MMKKRMTAGMLATLMAAVLPVSACAAQNSAPQPQLNTAEHMQYMNGYTAVSYTHLDVYKRQHYHCGDCDKYYPDWMKGYNIERKRACLNGTIGFKRSLYERAFWGYFIKDNL